jgi:hypothetical protein
MKLDFYNNDVWVKLSLRGEEILKLYLLDIARVFDTKGALAVENSIRMQNQTSWLKLSLQRMVQVFGGHDLKGQGSPFEDNVVHTECPF